MVFLPIVKLVKIIKATITANLTEIHMQKQILKIKNTRDTD